MLKKLNIEDLKNVTGGVIVKKYYYGGDTRAYKPFERFYEKENAPTYLVFDEKLNNISLNDFLKLKGGYNEDAFGKFATYDEAKVLAEKRGVSTALVDFTK